MNVDRSESVSAAIANIPVVEPDCLSRLFAQHYRRVLLAAYRILGNMADAEDIAQGVFLRLREAEMPAIANAGSYLYRAAINGALDLLRSRNRAALEPLDAADDIAGTGQGASPEADAFASELARWLRSAMGELTPRAAEMFALRYLEEFSNGEIAGLLLCSIGVYGMVSYSVSRSVRDIGIRMALGADGAKVMRLCLAGHAPGSDWRGRWRGSVCGCVGGALQHDVWPRRTRPHRIHFHAAFSVSCGLRCDFHPESASHAGGPDGDVEM